MIRRNYQVIGLTERRDRFTVVVLHEGAAAGIDLGVMVSEFVDPAELAPGGLFDGYFSKKEARILRRGLYRWKDRDPRTGRPRGERKKVTQSGKKATKKKAPTRRRR